MNEYTTITAIDAELAAPEQTGFAWAMDDKIEEFFQQSILERIVRILSHRTANRIWQRRIVLYINEGEEENG